METYTWVAFYKELASRLLEYKYDRDELIKKVFQIFDKTGLAMPTLEYDNKIVDIDPFTFFGLFNKNSSLKNRQLITSAVAEIFDLQTPVPQDFDGIPTLNPLRAAYYPFAYERGENDINILWELFEEALKYSPEGDRERLTELIDRAVEIKYNGVAKITMGLYWIAPDVFLSMDDMNKRYIYQSDRLPEEIKNKLPSYVEMKNHFRAELYLDLVETIRLYLEQTQSGNLMEFSSEAWQFSKLNSGVKDDGVSERGGLGDNGIAKNRYWVYSPGRNAEKWEEFYRDGVMAIGWGKVGDLEMVLEEKDNVVDLLREQYGLSGSLMNINLCLFEFCKTMQPGDVVFVKQGRNKIVGRGIVESDYYYNSNREDDYKHTRHIKWTNKGDWPVERPLAMKTLTELTRYPTLVKELNELIDDADDVEYGDEESLKDYPKYDMDDFLSDVYSLNEDDYVRLADLLATKKNVILQGSPGVGKTFAAKRLAYSLMKMKDPNRVCLVQFHQSYSYEDFMEGFRPSLDGAGFELKKGVFYNFCEIARENHDKDYYFIIDEINRGNLSKIFGELFMLIEADKRNDSIGLLYSGDEFQVPPNVYIIGMMNTADRSLALLDYALRRRFAFFELKPAFDSDGFEKYQRELNNEKFNNLVEAVKRINQKIMDDPSLGSGFRIGHSYFCNMKTVSDRTLRNIVQFELLPLLKEYWFDSEENYNRAKKLLEDAIR